MKKRSRLVLIVLGGLVVLAICVVTALGIRTMVNRVANGGSLFSFQANRTATSGPATETVPAGTAIAVTPGESTSVAGLPTRSPVSLVENPCYNLLYPILPDTTWKYEVRARGDVYNVQMAIPAKSGNQATLSISALPSGFSTQSTVDCSQGGVENLPQTTTGMQVQDILKGSLSFVYVSGKLSPTFDEFEAADWDLAWSGSYLVSGTSVLEFQGNDYSILLNQAPLTVSCQTAGRGLGAFESITVRAGTFQAMRISCTIVTQASLALNNWSVTGSVTGQFSEWYAPYVGLVRLQPESLYVTSPLVAFPVPVYNSGIELVEFTSGQ